MQIVQVSGVTVSTPNNTMSKPRFKAAILVVSTTASKDPSTDTSAWILKGVFEKEGAEQWDVVDTEIVGDVVLDIQRTITKWTDQEPPINLILTTGGTGFATFDNTPEAGPFIECCSTPH